MICDHTVDISRGLGRAMRKNCSRILQVLIFSYTNISYKTLNTSKFLNESARFSDQPSTTAAKNEFDQNSTKGSTSGFNHEVGRIRKRGLPLQKPRLTRGASKWQSTNENSQNFLVCTTQGDHPIPTPSAQVIIF